MTWLNFILYFLKNFVYSNELRYIISFPVCLVIKVCYFFNFMTQYSSVFYIPFLYTLILLLHNKREIERKRWQSHVRLVVCFRLTEVATTKSFAHHGCVSRTLDFILHTRLCNSKIDDRNDSGSASRRTCTKNF